MNFPTGSWGPHPRSDSGKKSNRFLCLRPPNKVAKGNLTSCSYRFWREARCMCKICCFSFTYWVLFLWRSHCLRRDRRLRRCSHDLWMCINDKESGHVFCKNASRLFTRYICYSRFGPLMNYFVPLETDIWPERQKKSVVFQKYIYFKETITVKWIEANCALKIIIFRYFAFFLELTFYFLLFIHFIFFWCTTFLGTHVRNVRTGSYAPGCVAPDRPGRQTSSKKASCVT